MATVLSLGVFAHPVTCNKCGDRLISPEWAEYFSERLILNWSCGHCGNRFETQAFVPVNRAVGSTGVPAKFYPSLVA